MSSVRFDESRGCLVADCKRCKGESRVCLKWRQAKDWHKWNLYACCEGCGHSISKAKRLVEKLRLNPPEMPDASRQKDLYE